MAYADYPYYKNTYLGTAIQEADFPRLALRASSFLDYYTQGRAGQNQDVNAVKMACCAVAEQYQSIDLARQAALHALQNSANAGEAWKLVQDIPERRRERTAGHDSGTGSTSLSCICCSAVFVQYGPPVSWKGVWLCSPML